MRRTSAKRREQMEAAFDKQIATMRQNEATTHTACVIARYNLSDEEWDATPERLRNALLKECAEMVG